MRAQDTRKYVMDGIVGGHGEGDLSSSSSSGGKKLDILTCRMEDLTAKLSEMVTLLSNSQAMGGGMMMMHKMLDMDNGEAAGVQETGNNKSLSLDTSMYGSIIVVCSSQYQ